MSASGAALLAPAKINLALHVIGRRADGYHLLDSIAVFADIGDRVTIAPAETLRLSVSGPFAGHAPGDDKDLAYRAALAFFAFATDPLPLVGRGLGEGRITPSAESLTPHPQPLPTRGRGVSIHVEKNIPAGAGLGGGSADAAAVLAGLDRFFAHGLTPETLSAIGLTLGADVPMCLAGTALRARGVGEEIERLTGWPALPLVLVWPGIPVSTAEAFKSLANRDNPPLPAPPRAPSLEDAAAYLADCRNDLEAPALRLCREIGAVLDALCATEGCRLARMSGSGSACFGLYADPAAASAAAESLSAARPGWWVHATVAS